MITHFHGRRLPEPGNPAGYAWIVDTYNLQVPMPPRLMAVADRHSPVSTDDWIMLRSRQQPKDNLIGHLQLAFRYEGINLSVLDRLFQVVPAEEITEMVQHRVTGTFSRRLWFIYEWMTGARLDLPDLGKVKYVSILDEELHYTGIIVENSARHKIHDNLPGTPAFCPTVRRTPELFHLLEVRNLTDEASAAAGRVPEDLMRRAAAFMLLDDSKASFAIENEKPTPAQGARWGQAIGEAGQHELSVDELNRLQQIVIGDARFVRLGIRKEEGFIGSHDRNTMEPIPSHISARWEDLDSLMAGLIDYDEISLARHQHPILTAAVLAFGFVFIHPYVDGNGRLHRYLFHHVLARAGFNPSGVVFPISAVILRNIEEYNRVLRAYSGPLLPFIDWGGDPKGNVKIAGETAHYYRFFDATEQATFLARCVQTTIDEDLPREVGFLKGYDRFAMGLSRIVDMPNKEIELLRKFLAQNDGKLSKRARGGEFEALSDDEVEQIEQLYAESWT